MIEQSLYTTMNCVLSSHEYVWWKISLSVCEAVSTRNRVVYLEETFAAGSSIAKWETGFQGGPGVHESLMILGGSRWVLFMPANLNESSYRSFCFFCQVNIP